MREMESLTLAMADGCGGEGVSGKPHEARLSDRGPRRGTPLALAMT